MKRYTYFRPPVLADKEAKAIGREASLNRWRARLLRHAARAIGAVLDEDDMPEKARDDLHDALTATVWWQLEFAAKGGDE